MEIHVDGSGWNGKSCAYAIVVKDTNTSFIVEYLSEMASDKMEYVAVLEGCKIASDRDIILTDSRLVYNSVHKRQVNKNAQVKWNVRQFVDAIQHYMEEKHLDIKWISREQNLAGKLLEERCIVKTMRINQVTEDDV